MKEIYVITNPNGEIFDDSVSHSEQSCKDCFTKKWVRFGGWDINLGYYQVSTMWDALKEAGFRCQKIKLNPSTTENK